MPNSFYRFQPAWNAGFYPDNQITSNLLNTVSSDLATYLATIASGIPLGQFKSLINTFVNQYNASPYFGDLSVSVSDSFCFPFQCYNFSIRNNSLFVIDNTQSVDFVVQFNLPDLTYSSYTLSSFTPGSYSGTFDYPAIPVEAEVSRSLQIVEQNGSAFFPLTYSFNSGTNIATSGLARGKNWQLDSSGNPTRLPADTLPKQNARTFNIAAQTAEDRYCISVMEKVINFSLSETDETLIQAYFNTFTVPDGWTASFTIVSGTYTRVLCLLYRDDRSLLMIGRLDINWLWQRFINEIDSSDTTYFNSYASTTPLPYSPLSSFQWLYGDWYDMEFVEFTDSCYVSPEFYAMPAIPGDNWQFNVPSDSGNLTGLNSALVGLFTQDGQFVQQIGNGVKPSTDCDCEPCALVLTYELTEAEWATYLTNVSQLNTEEATNLNFAIYRNDVQIEFAGLSFVNPADPYTFENIEDAGLSVSPPVVLTFADGVYTFTCTIPDAICGDVYKFNNQISDASVFPTTWITIFESDSFECPNVANTTNQLNASCTIPAVKNGCYRMGLYSTSSSTGANCNLTFTKTLGGSEFDAWIEDFITIMFSGTKRVGWQIPGVTPMYIYDGNIIPPPYNPADISIWCNTNIPGMTSTFTTGPDLFSWSWVVSVPCGEEAYSMINCAVDETTQDCVNNLWSSDPELCICSGDSTDFYLYSLSNIINIDGSDCFSTMLEFWANDNSIAQGFEYFNGWKQRVRLGINGGGAKPVIEENLYRQSNGVHRRPQNKQDLSLDLHTDFIDEQTQLALVDATRHPYLVWNNKSIFVKGDVDVATIQDFTTQSSFETLAQVKFSALVQGFQPKNSSCLTC